MINITKLWTGAAQPADHIRYGLGHGSNLPNSSTRSEERRVGKEC